jgi:F0F1-type ATP synthase assembly protein I
MMAQTRRPEENDDKSAYTQWMGVGFEFCGVIAVLCYVGYLLDRALNTSPWLLILLSILGFVGMLYSIIRRAMKQ